MRISGLTLGITRRSVGLNQGLWPNPWQSVPQRVTVTREKGKEKNIKNRFFEREKKRVAISNFVPLNFRKPILMRFFFNFKAPALSYLVQRKNLWSSCIYTWTPCTIMYLVKIAHSDSLMTRVWTSTRLDLKSTHKSHRSFFLNEN